MRVLRVLSEVDAIYAEDTRHSGLLLSHYKIKKPLLSCHEHNEAERAEEIVQRLKQGENIAYISDAGMPCISDPGARLIRACIESSQEYTVLPGASASVTALSLSGLPTEKFLFFGFLPRSGKERKAAINFLADSTVTSVIYESPNRVYNTLSELMQCAGENRMAALVREITKLYEESVQGTLAELCMRYENDAPKGECVIVLDGKCESHADADAADQMINNMLEQGLKSKLIAKTVADVLDLPKNGVYARVLELSGKK